jgi:hypothetical protein
MLFNTTRVHAPGHEAVREGGRFFFREGGAKDGCPRAATTRKIAWESARSPIGQLSVVDRSIRQQAAQVCDNATTGAVGKSATKHEHGEAARDQNLRAL